MENLQKEFDQLGAAILTPGEPAEEARVALSLANYARYSANLLKTNAVQNNLACAAICVWLMSKVRPNFTRLPPPVHLLYPQGIAKLPPPNELLSNTTYYQILIDAKMTPEQIRSFVAALPLNYDRPFRYALHLSPLILFSSYVLADYPFARVEMIMVCHTL